MTERSGNEIAVCVTKAARGAGVALADAEDLGAAAHWLAGDLACICDALEAFATGRDPSQAAVCKGPAMVAQLLADPSQIVSSGAIDHPKIVSALAKQASLEFETPIACTSDGTKTTLKQDGEMPKPPATARADVDDVTWARLTTLVEKIFVPATEASRLAGAGAGLTDND